MVSLSLHVNKYTMKGTKATIATVETITVGVTTKTAMGNKIAKLTAAACNRTSEFSAAELSASLSS